MEENYPSPGGTYTVLFDVFEVRMSHWVEVPRILRIADQAAVFDLQGDVWSTDLVYWPTDTDVELKVRKYPGRISCSLFLNFHTGTGKAICGAQHFEGYLYEVRSWVLSR